MIPGSGRFQGQGRSRFTIGLPPDELWGISNGPRVSKERSKEARRRHYLKKRARARGLPLKEFLRRGELTDGASAGGASAGGVSADGVLADGPT